MALVVINVDRSELPRHTDEQFEEWIRYVVGDSYDIKRTNPLFDEDLESAVMEIG